MNLESINKWLDEEYGCSYTRLEELHDFVIEQDLKHQEKADKEINRLNNIIDELEKYLKKQMEYYKLDTDYYVEYKLTLDKLNKLRGDNKQYEII